MPHPNYATISMTVGIHRRRVQWWGAAVVVGLLLAGCGTAADSGTSATIGDEHQDAGGLPSPHVHGVAINPGDDLVYLATHDGLFRYDDTGPTRVGPVIDLMGFTLTGPDQFYASGHPGQGTDLPDPVGLIATTDAGQTWTQLSRQGQSDFHALTASPSGVLGNDGTLLVSLDGRQWRELQIPIPPTALAASPIGSTVLAATDAGLLMSNDAAQSWTSPVGAPPLQVLAWTRDGTAVGATDDGAVYSAQIPGSAGGVAAKPRPRRPSPPARPQAGYGSWSSPAMTCSTQRTAAAPSHRWSRAAGRRATRTGSVPAHRRERLPATTGATTDPGPLAGVVVRVSGCQDRGGSGGEPVRRVG
jgi:hypothetical protein